jgi:hypothetical protein
MFFSPEYQLNDQLQDAQRASPSFSFGVPIHFRAEILISPQDDPGAI